MRRAVGVFGGLLLLDFVVLLVMLATDKNLQSDFGGVSPYYSHWYGLLALGVLTLIAGVAILALGGRTGSDGRPSTLGRCALWGGGILPWVAVAAMIGILATYQQVGFSSASQFAQYLFGVTAYSGTLSYVPWLYDLLLALFLVSAVVGLIAIVKVRAPPMSSIPK